MKRIALFGGAFDPPHFGHVLFITALLNSDYVDEVWLVPSGGRSDKAYTAAAHDRCTMVQRMVGSAFPGDRRVTIDRTQVDFAETMPSTTMGLIDHMRTAHPGHRFFVVIGSDLVPDLPGWYAAERLRNEAEFLVIPRLGIAPLPAAPGYRLHVLTSAEGMGCSVSSTVVRQLLQQGKSVAGMIPAAVESYIKEHGLYGCAPSETERNSAHTLFEGEYLRVAERRGWEFVERKRCDGVVAIVAVTKEKKLILTSQYRVPLDAEVIELPAGLMNDSEGAARENVHDTARRELREETGYEAGTTEYLLTCTSSAGLTSETVHLIYAADVQKGVAGGGDERYPITVHEVSIAEASAWLTEMANKGRLIDPRVYTGLHLALERAQIMP